MRNVETALNILAMSLADRGGKIEQVNIIVKMLHSPNCKCKYISFVVFARFVTFRGFPPKIIMMFRLEMLFVLCVP